MFKLLIPALLSTTTMSTLPAIACQAPQVGRTAIVSQLAIGQTTYKGSTYSLAKAKGADGQTYTVVYREKKGSCYLSYADPAGDSSTLSDSLPRSVAIALAIEHLKSSIQKKGQSAVQAKIDKVSNFAPEYNEAAIKLGLTIPSSAKILPWDLSPDMREEKLK